MWKWILARYRRLAMGLICHRGRALRRQEDVVRTLMEDSEEVEEGEGAGEEEEEREVEDFRCVCLADLA